MGCSRAIAGGATLVDCTSGDPATSRRIAARLAEHGVDFLDAPVSGGVSGAEKGTLTVMVGGDAAVLERVRPVLEAFGKKIVHCGDVGAGDAVKAVNNALLAVHIWSTAEGLAALAKAGVEAEVALDVINASSGRSNASMNLFPERVLTRAFPAHLPARAARQGHRHRRRRRARAEGARAAAPAHGRSLPHRAQRSSARSPITSRR